MTPTGAFPPSSRTSCLAMRSASIYNSLVSHRRSRDNNRICQEEGNICVCVLGVGVLSVYVCVVVLVHVCVNKQVDQTNE